MASDDALNNLGTAANLIGVSGGLQLLSSLGHIITWLSDVYHSSEERESLISKLREFQAIYRLLANRNRNALSGNPILSAVIQLSQTQFKMCFEELEEKLRNDEALYKRTLKKLTWSYDKSKLEGLMSQLLQFTTLATNAVEDDHL